MSTVCLNPLSRLAHLWFLLVWTLAALGCTPTPAFGLASVESPDLEERPPGSAKASNAKRGPPKQRPRWCFGAGAPLVGVPVVGPDGRLVLTTSEGYVHRLQPDGRYLWSFTMAGPASGTLRVLPNGLILVPTVEGLLYAIYDNGRLAFTSRAPERFATGLSGGNDHSYLVSLNHHVYSVTAGGRFFLRSRLPGPAFGEPLPLAKGEVAVLTVGGTLVRSRWAGGSRKTELAGSADQPLAGAQEGRFYALAGGRLAAFGQESEPLWVREGVAWVVAGDESVVAGAGDEAIWLDSDSGQVLGSAALRRPPTAQPAPLGASQLLVPDGEGLSVMGRDRGVLGQLDTGEKRVVQVTYDAPRRRILMVTEPGILCSFDEVLDRP